MVEQQSTLTVSAGSVGEEQRSRDMVSIMSKAAKHSDVSGAKAAWDKAEGRFAHVRRRARDVEALIRGNNTALDSERAKFADDVAGLDVIPNDVSSLMHLSALNSELTRVQDGFTLDRLPRCEVRSLLSQAEFMGLLSREISNAASVRLQATIRSLAPALLIEGGLSFDPTKTASGMLQAQARELLEVSAALRDQAQTIVAKFNLEINESVN